MTPGRVNLVVSGGPDCLSLARRKGREHSLGCVQFLLCAFQSGFQMSNHVKLAGLRSLRNLDYFTCHANMINQNQQSRKGRTWILWDYAN